MSRLFAFTMPKWGIEMQEGLVSEWHLSEGVAFSKGELLASIETDKIVNDIEAEFDGYCVRCIAEEGDTYAVGELMAVFGDAASSAEQIDHFISTFVPPDVAASGEESTLIQAQASDDQGDHAAGEAGSVVALVKAHPGQEIVSDKAWAAASTANLDIESIKDSGRHQRIQLQDVEQALRPAQKIERSACRNAVEPSANDRTDATPLAALAAMQNGIDLRTIKGTGRNGRIRRHDVISATENTAGPTFIPLTGMRGKIATRLSTAWREIPHFHLQSVVGVDALLAVRERYSNTSTAHISLNDYIVAAVARTLHHHPAVNVNVSAEGITRFSHANIAIAIAVEEGLITPVVKAAQELTLVALSEESRRLIDAAKAKRLSLNDLSSGTFTVSNLGMFGVSSFTAVINPPQGAILSVGEVSSNVVERDGQFVAAKQITLTLGCDHRAIDGAVGARFLADLKGLLESPDSLVAE